MDLSKKVDADALANAGEMLVFNSKRLCRVTPHSRLNASPQSGDVLFLGFKNLTSRLSAGGAIK
ncbi:hypothetical protein [Paenibacillus sp. BK720]|uniref:hypothetical protein n=1 Tax=Paenibacillus sp. BK720 TaxID=2587092 RepID=UPI001ABBCE63|nr:hypothetical protein [Paenibacillus sp. BK720]